MEPFLGARFRVVKALLLRQVDIEVTAPNEDANAIARGRAQLPNVDLPITQRNAQLVIAREYGYAGWRDLTAEVSKRLDQDWSGQSRKLDVSSMTTTSKVLKQLLTEYSTLLSWCGDNIEL